MKRETNGALFDRATGMAVLAKIKKDGVPFVVMGSFALELILGNRLVDPPRDLDLFLPNDLEAIESFARVTEALGFSLTVWQEPLRRPVSKDQLSGRFYLRAERSSETGILIVDGTYECQFLSFEQAWRHRLQKRQIPVICLKHQCLLMQARGSKKDRTRLHILKNTPVYQEITSAGSSNKKRK